MNAVSQQQEEGGPQLTNHPMDRTRRTQLVNSPSGTHHIHDRLRQYCGRREHLSIKHTPGWRGVRVEHERSLSNDCAAVFRHKQESTLDLAKLPLAGPLLRDCIQN